MRPRFAVLLGIGMVPLLVSCLASRPVGDSGSSGPQALGSLEVASQVLGNHVLTPTVCTSGDRQQFLGADLSDPGTSLVLRLAVDPLEGPAVRVFSAEAPFDRSVVFRRSDCAVFHFSLDSTGWRVNDVEDYRVTLQLDCSRPGERVSGSASSSHCT